MTEWIAEVGSNHNGDLGRACALVDAAAACGCWAVKFQYLRADRIYAPAFRHKVTPLQELSDDWLILLAERARANGLQFGCTVYAQEHVPLVATIADWPKASSYSLLDHRLLDALRMSKKTVMLSTGMADRTQVAQAVHAATDAWVAATWVWPTLLHCVSCYPTPLEEVNLSRIQRLRQQWGAKASIGYSDHTRRPAVVLAAALRYAADVVECHIDLDGRGAEYGGGHVWLVDDLAGVIAMDRAASAAAGNGLDVQACERREMDWRADPADGLRPLMVRRHD